MSALSLQPASTLPVEPESAWSTPNWQTLQYITQVQNMFLYRWNVKDGMPFLLGWMIPALKCWMANDHMRYS